MDDRERTALLQLEMETLWSPDDSGRIVRSRDLSIPFEPLLVVAGHPGGVIFGLSATLREGLDEVVARELLGAAPDRVGWAPDSAPRLRAIIEEAGGPIISPLGGPSWVMQPVLAAPAPGIVRSSDPGAADRDLSAPWAVAVVDGVDAAVCETARSAPGSVEAGVWTIEGFRRRGLAFAVTAAWSALVAERTIFYSTSWSNVASQGVARRLGLEPLGQWWQLYRRED